jgi:hypothetical protein
MTLRFAVVHEAEADFDTATELADRELIDAISWLDEDLMGNQRGWVGHSEAGDRLTWKQLKRLALEAGVTPMGHFGGEPAFPDARAARRAIAYLLKELPELSAILLIRDQDDQPDRRDGLNQARREDHSGVPVVVGLAIVEREAWVISGFDPVDEPERTRHSAERDALGYDPCTRSHELTACKNDSAKRSPKRVLGVLCGNDRDRERRCWTEAPLELLRERGSGNGLALYLQEVRDLLAPLIGHVSEG